MAAIQIAPLNWCAELYVGVSRCLRGSDPVYFAEAIKSGECQGWKVNGGESYMITRIDKDTIDGSLVLVVCCFEGANLKQTATYLTKWAGLKGMRAIRFHTVHKGLHRLISELNPEYIETVFEVKTNGQSV